MSPSHVLSGGTSISLRAVTYPGATPGSAPSLETAGLPKYVSWPPSWTPALGRPLPTQPHPTPPGDSCGREAGREAAGISLQSRVRLACTHSRLCVPRGPVPRAAVSQQGPHLPGAQSGLEGERVKQAVKEKVSPGQVAELVGAPSPYAKVTGSVPGQGTYRSQPVSALLDGAAS